MKKQFFSIALCSALIMQNAVLLHAEGDEIPILMDDNRLNEKPSYNTNDIPSGDEGTVPDGIKVEYHTIDEIKNYYYTTNIVDYLETEYSVSPDIVNAPYTAGQLTDATLNDALNSVNMIRYIAGLNYDVQLDTDYNNMVQAGALINAINNNLSNDPGKPAGMSDDLYSLGLNGNKNSNVAFGYSSLASAVTDKWLYNADENSLADSISSRRWLLNAKMAKTGFGQVGSYSGMYSHDTTGSSVYSSNVWPAQNTPIQFFSAESPWSVSTGEVEDINDITVVMEDMNSSTVKKWAFSYESSDGEFAVDNSEELGIKGAIIWKPNNLSSYNDGDRYEITITGSKIGRIHYVVRFFDLTQDHFYFSPESLIMEVGETAKVSYGILPGTSTDKISKLNYIYNNGVFSVRASSSQLTIQANKPGIDGILLTSAKGITDEYFVTVRGITISQTSYTAVLGKKYRFSASYYPEDEVSSFTWSSSDTNIATVDQSGLVTPISEGTTTITVSANGYSATCELTVTKPDVTGITVTPSTLTLVLNDTSQLTAAVEPAEADQTVTWSSSDDTVATVDNNGIVTAVTKGTATITATTSNGKTAICQVTVESTSNYTIENLSLNLESPVGVKCKVYVPEEEVSKISGLVWFDGKWSDPVLLSKLKKSTVNGKVTRVFTTDVATPQLRDTIKVKLQNETGTALPLTYDGVTTTEGQEYTAYAHIKEVMDNSSNAKLVRLAKTLDDLGKYSQYLFSYNTDNIEGDLDPVEEIPAGALDQYAMAETGTAEGIKYSEIKLEFASDTVLRVYFELTGDNSYKDYTFTVDGEEVTPQKSGSRYVIKKSQIASALLDEEHVFKVCKKGSEDGIEIKCSALSYVQKMLAPENDQPDTDLRNVLIALYWYNDAANKAFGQ